MLFLHPSQGICCWPSLAAFFIWPEWLSSRKRLHVTLLVLKAYRVCLTSASHVLSGRLKKKEKRTRKNPPTEPQTLFSKKTISTCSLLFLGEGGKKFFSSGGSCLRTTQELRSRTLLDTNKYACKPVPRIIHSFPAWGHNSEAFYLHKSDYLQFPPKVPEWNLGRIYRRTGYRQQEQPYELWNGDLQWETKILV